MENMTLDAYVSERRRKKGIEDGSNSEKVVMVTVYNLQGAS